MFQVWQVQVAAPTEAAALKLAQGAVEARLAAGGQVVGPLTSLFWHDGKLGSGEEWQAILKTTDSGYPALEKFLVEQHEWTSPEITAVPVVAGLRSYLNWVARTTGEEVGDAGL
jgi:periplasmic divalent cation tolerance protein